MEEKKKTGWICCSVDTASHGDKRVQFLVVESTEDVHKFINENVDNIKNEVKEYIENGTLVITNETIKDDSYCLCLDNAKKSLFDIDSCYFKLDSFEFTYGEPFNFNSF